MSSEAVIAAKESLHELRARQRGFSLEEERLACDIQQCIAAQALLEERIVNWEKYIEVLKASDKLKQSEGSWILKKLLG